jgi:hypothetical protein
MILYVVKEESPMAAVVTHLRHATVSAPCNTRDVKKFLSGAEHPKHGLRYENLRTLQAVQSSLRLPSCSVRAMDGDPAISWASYGRWAGG